MKINGTKMLLLKKLEIVLNGIFTIEDLAILFPFKHTNTFYRDLRQFEKLNLLNRFCRGLYVSENYNLKYLSQKICEDSYISFETILAESGKIGAYNPLVIRSVKLGKNRQYEFKDTLIKHVSIDEKMYNFFEIQNGIKKAIPEKALIDCLYFQTKGMKFSFSLSEDIDIQQFDIKKIQKILSHYKNKKFIKYVQNILGLKNEI